MAIAAKLRSGIRAGVSMRVLHDAIKDMKDGPQSLQTLYKVYRADIADARSSIQEQVGNVVVSAALKGDIKAAELYLRSKGGWNPTIKIEEVDADETSEDTGALEDLMRLLNVNKDTPEEE